MSFPHQNKMWKYFDVETVMPLLEVLQFLRGVQAGLAIELGTLPFPYAAKQRQELLFR
jgi:hypothetical protein